MTSFADALAGWHDFYTLVGASAATLVGLMFVSVTFGASLVRAETMAQTRSFVDPTVMHFVQVLFTACLVLAPTIESWIFGGILIVIGCGRTFGLVRVGRNLARAARDNGDVELSDWISTLVLPFAMHVGLAGAGLSIVLEHPSLSALAVVTVGVLLTGVYSAWEMMLWLAVIHAKRADANSKS